MKTLKRVSAILFWPCLKHAVKSFVQNCLICQQHEYETLALVGLLQPLPIPNKVWEDISLDFIVGLPPSNDFDTILVVVDMFSKYIHFLALSHPFTTKTTNGGFFVRKLSGCMVYRAPFFQIVMLSSQVPFSKNFFALVALIFVWVLPIIPNLTVKLRWLIDALKLM